MQGWWVPWPIKPQPSTRGRRRCRRLSGWVAASQALGFHTDERWRRPTMHCFASCKVCCNVLTDRRTLWTRECLNEAFQYLCFTQ
eukprot:SAG11_NODE_2858_length_2900_cov_1.881471_5_plen_85_part_00